jgi:hypothetical protein
VDPLPLIASESHLERITRRLHPPPVLKNERECVPMFENIAVGPLDPLKENFFVWH